MASTADAAAGWEIYRDSDFALTLDEINATLQRRGYAPISLRTYQHYGKLQRYGYQRYVPINQLDVKTLRDPFIDQARRGREHPIQTLTEVELRVLVADEIRAFSGTAIELSSTEVVVRLVGDEMAQFFSELGSATPVGELLFRSTGELRRGLIERLTLDVDQGLSTVRVDLGTQADFTELLQPSVLSEELRFNIRIGVASAPGLSDAARHLYWLTQAADASRAIVSELSRQLAPGKPVDVGIVRVRSLSLGSIEIVIGVPVSAGLVLYGAFWGWLKVRQAYWSSEKTKQEALQLRWENEQKNLRGKADLGPVVSRLRATLSRRLRASGIEPTDEVDEERAITIANRQLMPAVAEIVEAADGDVEVEVEGATDQTTAGDLAYVRELPPPADA